MRTLVAVLFSLFVLLPVGAATFGTGGPASTNNDDSCDIALLPAATLLLPYFEVNVNDHNGETTLFTVTNVTNRPQIARVTLWTDWSYPVIDFNIWLTGYDTQSIDLYDVIVRGVIAPDRGTGIDISPIGDFSTPENPAIDVTSCNSLPGFVPPIYVQRMKQSLTTGSVAALGNSIPACNRVGGTHANAIGYVTIDLVRVCGVRLPDDPNYFREEIAFENVLTGDFIQVNPSQNFAQGSPMVHIRAIPEGSNFATRLSVPATYGVNFKRTFYSRYLGGEVYDARQPLPSQFVARWIAGGPNHMETSFKIWREGRTSQSSTCADWEMQGGRLPITELTMFDEDENASMISEPICCFNVRKELPSTSRTNVTASDIFPPQTGDALAGWMYFNLDNRENDLIASQNWVVASMRAQNRFSTDIDATALGNGCTPETAISNVYTGTQPIGPAPNTNP
jgi:hypothetical protein